MSIKFSALEIGSGDAFLIEDDEIKILFDSGGSKTTLENLLIKKDITELDLAICSHNDVDHTNGFIGLLQSSKIDIDEIWLPGLWANILQFIKDGHICLDDIYFYDENANCHNNGDNHYNIFDESTVSIEQFEDELHYFSDFDDLRYILYHLRHYRHYYINKNTISFALRLGRIIKIATLAYQKGLKIRWFEPVGPYAPKEIDYGFIPLNSKEIGYIKKIKDTKALMYALALTEENKHSLVFEYCKDGIPVIRFSADSDCTCQSVSRYNDNIIITAPHHGSDANKVVYTSISGNNTIWIRSDGKSRKRPCQEFKDLTYKYCLACNSRNFKSEICFEYNNTNKTWIHKTGNICNC